MGIGFIGFIGLYIYIYICMYTVQGFGLGVSMGSTSIFSCLNNDKMGVHDGKGEHGKILLGMPG